MLARPAPIALLLTGLLGLVACTSSDATDDASGNMVGERSVAAPAHPRWFSGQLVVEPAGTGHACLLLSSGGSSYVLRSAAAGLEVVAWQTNGAFDATRSGIARAGRLVAPYGDQRTSVRGQVVAEADPECGSHPTLAIARATRGDHGGSEPSEPSEPATTTTPTTAPDPAAGGGVDPLVEHPEVTMTGTLGVVRGNQGSDHCLVIETDHGAYAVTGHNDAFDIVISSGPGGIIDRETGIHHHGRNRLGMYATVGQRVELVGWIDGTNTDFTCSRYYDFVMTDVT